MTTNQLDDAFESFLAGRPVPAQGTALVAFGEAVREISARPGRPSPQLAELLVTGLLTDPVGPSTELVPTARQPAYILAAGRPRRRRRTMFTILAAAAAKFASAGAIAQATTGVGLALVSVTGAGAAGVLPGAVQDGVADVIESVTPFDLPDSAGLPALPEQTEVPENDRAGTGAPEDLPRPEDIPADEQFGTSVSDDAQDGGVDGEQVSTDARETHQPEQPATPRTQAPERPVEQPATPRTQAPERQVEQPVTDSAPEAAERPAPAAASQPQDPAGAQEQGGSGRP